MTPYLYTQPAGSTTWPTLASMISSKKRLLNFVDSGADASVPWYTTFRYSSLSHLTFCASVSSSPNEYTFVFG